ncbi:ComEA family DNA-binding protein [Mycolicibacterium vaccae]|uniref:ComEA family DNA-binding protein n=1 Tax=Mycolicibacterium vaccae TaxID=1810 RepID=UPI003CF51A5F
MSTELPTERLHRRVGADVDEDDTDLDEQSARSLSRWLPDQTPTAPSAWLARIRADPGRAGVLALGAVGLVAVLVTIVTLLGDQPAAVVSAKLPPVEAVPTSAGPGEAGASPAPPGPAEPVVVSVVGLVRTPGLVTLPPGSRIADALDAAGGAVDGADVLGLNMARRVTDGEQIVVGIDAPPGQPAHLGSSVVSESPAAAPPGAETEKPGAATGLVDLNSATAEQLDVLPGIGPVTAAAIVAWRDANGPFQSVDQLGEVDGIGPARLDKLRDLVRV